MSYMILLAGLPAAGKSTFAGYLSKETGIPVLSKDFIKEKLFDRLGFQSRSEKVKLGDASRDIMYGLAEKFMEIGNPVILENNFESDGRDELMELISRYQYHSITVFFGGNIEMIYERFIKRNHSAERHLGHVINTCYPAVGPWEPIHDISLEDYRKMIMERGIQDFTVGGDFIFVDTTDLSSINNQDILLQIKNKLSI